MIQATVLGILIHKKGKLLYSLIVMNIQELFRQCSSTGVRQIISVIVWFLVLNSWSNTGLLDMETGLYSDRSRISVQWVSIFLWRGLENWWEQLWSPGYHCRDLNLKTNIDLAIIVRPATRSWSKALKSLLTKQWVRSVGEELRLLMWFLPGSFQALSVRGKDENKPVVTGRRIRHTV